MNSPKKHKPLSPEELFEWLDQKSDKQNSFSSSNSDFDNLDEFERDAMEGFESFGSSEEAKALLDEINLEISKKIQEKGPSRRNGVIWFSAAASLLLIISLSVFLVNKTEEETGSNIALNTEVSKDSGKEFAPQAEEAETSKTTPDQTTAEGKKDRLETVVESHDQMPLEKLAEEKEEPQKISASDFSNSGIANGTFATTTQNQIDASKNTIAGNTNIATKVTADGDVVTTMDAKAAMPVMQDNETKKKVKEEDKNMNDEVAATISQESLSKAETIVFNEKSNKDEKFKERKVAKKAAVTKAEDTSPAYLQNTATTTVPSGYVTDAVYKVARYDGGESAIKTNVLEYLKKNAIAEVMKGSFKVNGTVNEKGKFILESVNSVNNECKDCESELKKALEAMPNWQPATQSGKAVSSKTSFVLKF